MRSLEVKLEKYREQYIDRKLAGEDTREVTLKIRYYYRKLEKYYSSIEQD